MSELMFTGWQVVGCAVMCLSTGIGIGALGFRLIDWEKLPDCSGCEEGEEVDCPYGGETDGCNNREPNAKALGW